MTCFVCRKPRPLTDHHLIPKKLHKKAYFLKRFAKEELRSRTAPCCRRCHDFIHECYSEMELGRNFNTVEALLADEKIARFAEWARKQRS